MFRILTFSKDQILHRHRKKFIIINLICIIVCCTVWFICSCFLDATIQNVRFFSLFHLTTWMMTNSCFLAQKLKILRQNSVAWHEFNRERQWKTRFYMFENLNPNEWMNGSEPMRVAERGPFAYTMKYGRVIEHADQVSILYRPHHQYHYDPENSYHKRAGYDEPITLPNVPYLVSIWKNWHH